MTLTFLLHQIFCPNTKNGLKVIIKNVKEGLPTLIPVILLISRKKQGKTSMRLLNVLLNSEITKKTINKRALPRGCNPRHLENKITSHTLVDTFDSKREVSLDSITLPEFDKSKTVEGK